MVEKLKAEIKGSLIYWVCDSQTNYVQFNIVLKYDPEGSDFFKKKKKLIFNICLEYILFKITKNLKYRGWRQWKDKCASFFMIF